MIRLPNFIMALYLIAIGALDLMLKSLKQLPIFFRMACER
ncbi:MAG: DUF3096 domain-containing protein [Methylomicrobium sp.]